MALGGGRSKRVGARAPVIFPALSTTYNMQQILTEWRKYLVEQEGSTLRKGMKDPVPPPEGPIAQVQTILKQLGYNLGTYGIEGVDGEYGPVMVAAVKKFQTDVGLKDDGVVGPNTRGALKKVAGDKGLAQQVAKKAVATTAKKQQKKLKPLDIKTKILRPGQYSYVFGTIDGDVIDSHNPNKLFYGASSNKPILALLNLMMCNNPENKGKCQCLQSAELQALLTYSGSRKSAFGGDSNAVNRALSGKVKRGSKGRKRNYAISRAKELCRPKNNAEASKFLGELGLDPNMKIRWGGGNNKQSAIGYYKFLALLMNPESHIKGAAQTILQWMSKEGRTDREHRGRFLVHLKHLQRMGLGVSSIFGKGGFAGSANNSAMIIDNKYIFALFSSVNRDTNNKKKSQVIKDMSSIMAGVLIKSGSYRIKK